MSGLFSADIKCTADSKIKPTALNTLVEVVHFVMQTVVFARVQGGTIA